ncbi:ATP-binding protein [Mucilaginibacter sp. McL0603]|uniref:ATP-binding protein n=1 Tax=Mucilaginibacter sp. McL0603 TaxID=3415670 RepID=UPI003CEC661D
MAADKTYISANDLSFAGVLQDVKKSRTALQPIWEAFTNALEAIKIKQTIDISLIGNIQVDIFVTETTTDSFEFSKLSIRDNGIGFNDSEFQRFNTFKLTSKGYKNLGSGRIQFVQYFDNTILESYFLEGEKCFFRKFTMSKKKGFLDKNALVYHESCVEIDRPAQVTTTLTFNTLLEDSNIYNSLNADTFKASLLERYISYLCANRLSLPQITINFHVQGKLQNTVNVSNNDIPSIEKSEIITLPYKEISSFGDIVAVDNKSESFKLDAYKISKDILKSNELKLSSKGEIIEESGIMLESLSENDNIKGNKFLFIVSSDYIDSRDTNIRGQLNIPSKESFTKATGDLFSNQEIFVEDIQEEINSTITKMYPEIEEVKQNHLLQFSELKEMFGLDEQIAQSINISINDSEAKILEKFYEAEAKKAATIDASIKESFDKLNKLDTTSDTYNEDLKKEINKLVRTIPLQNKTSLTHYVARRKLVLDLFQKILDRSLEVQRSGRNFDEALIHNLLYQQHSGDSETSDLWIISEDFIYFKGASESQLDKLTIDGKKVFKDKFTEEEDRYLTSLGENRKLKRPDILLFPEEGKCIIIEFKTPDTNISEHLTQIDSYANLIRNYSEDEFQIIQFYGYLIGESIEPRDVLGRVSSYEHSYQFDYLFRPATKVIGFDGRTDGAIYSEVIKYSTLLKRAQQRNRIFLSKLTHGTSSLNL